MFLAELAPGAVGGKHYHPRTELFGVLEGAFIHEPDGKPPVTLKMGEAGHNLTKNVHYVKNASMTERAKDRVGEVARGNCAGGFHRPR